VTRFASFYEDVVIGARMELGSYLFERDKVLRFARAYDPQPFHLSDEAAAKTHFGRLAASGWHTAAACMSSHIATRDRIRDEARARGETVVPSGPSPGIRDLRWLRPVFAGDRISYSSMVIGKRLHLRPGWGIMMSRSIGTNESGVRVYEASGAVLVPMREAGSVPVE
jgi:acyl dehydratase